MQLGRRRMDVALREDDARVARAHVFGKAHGLRFGNQRVEAFVALHAVDVAETLAVAVQDAPHDVEPLGGAADVQLVGVEPDERAAPGAAAVQVAHHLGFIDHGCVPRGPRVEHLDRGRHVRRALHDAAFFASDERAGEAPFVRGVRHLGGEQAQRSQVDAVLGAPEGLEGVVRLAGVRGTDMDDDGARTRAAGGVGEVGVGVCARGRLGVRTAQGCAAGPLAFLAGREVFSQAAQLGARGGAQGVGVRRRVEACGKLGLEAGHGGGEQLVDDVGAHVVRDGGRPELPQGLVCVEQVEVHTPGKVGSSVRAPRLRGAFDLFPTGALQRAHDGAPPGPLVAHDVPDDVDVRFRCADEPELAVRVQEEVVGCRFACELVCETVEVRLLAAERGECVASGRELHDELCVQLKFRAGQPCTAQGMPDLGVDVCEALLHRKAVLL